MKPHPQSIIISPPSYSLKNRKRHTRARHAVVVFSLAVGCGAFWIAVARYFLA